MKQLTQASCPERPDMYNYGPHTTGPCILLYKIFHLMREGMSYRTVAMKVNVVRNVSFFTEEEPSICSCAMCQIWEPNVVH